MIWGLLSVHLWSGVGQWPPRAQVPFIPIPVMSCLPTLPAAGLETPRTQGPAARGAKTMARPQGASLESAACTFPRT